MKPLEKEDKPLPKIYFKTVEVGVIMSLKNMAAAKTLYSKDSTENLIVGMHFAQPSTIYCVLPPMSILRGTGGQSTACSIRR